MLKFSEISVKEQTDPRVPELARIATVLQRRFLLDLFKKTSAKRLSIPQYTLLGFLAAESGVPMGHLAKQMGHATSATTGLVDRLEAAGLVRRASVKGDRGKNWWKSPPRVGIWWARCRRSCATTSAEFWRSSIPRIRMPGFGSTGRWKSTVVNFRVPSLVLLQGLS